MKLHPSTLPPPSMITSSGFTSMKEGREPTAVDDANPNKLNASAATDHWNTKRTKDQEVLLRLRRMKRRLFLSLTEVDTKETKEFARSSSRPVDLQNIKNEIPTKSSPIHLAEPHPKVRFCDIIEEIYFQQPKISYPKPSLKVPPRKKKLRFVAYLPLPEQRPLEDTQHIPELELGETFDVESTSHVSTNPYFDTAEQANCLTDRTNSYSMNGTVTLTNNNACENEWNERKKVPKTVFLPSCAT